jgi:putative ATPase
LHAKTGSGGVVREERGLGQGGRAAETPLAWPGPRAATNRSKTSVGVVEAGDDLFASAAAQRLAGQAPLATRMRPRSLDELVGQTHLVGPGKPLRALIEADRLSSCILWGPAGTGKTTIARLVAQATAKAFESMSAVAAGVKEVRQVVEHARTRLGQQGRGTILFLDEIHRFNRTQQDALLPHVEDGLLTLIGATTENPFFEVNGPLRSRSTLFRLEPLGFADLRALVIRALTDPERGLGGQGLTIDDEAADHLAGRSDGDARAALNGLEVAAALAAEAGRTAITLSDAETAINLRAVRYGRDEHYDVISAFIKSIRGSDPDAGLYWLARMLEAGEDARFIARRLVILASEDIGMADPMSLVVADAAARAVEFVGLPEAQLNLAQAVVHLATAPKSNRVAQGIWSARRDAREAPAGEVPLHLRDSHYPAAKGLGHGKGYVYPHDDPSGHVLQEYRPGDVAGRRYYDPSDHGAEAVVKERMRGWGRGSDQEVDG